MIDIVNYWYIKKINKKDNFKFMDLKDIKLLNLLYPPQEGI